MPPPLYTPGLPPISRGRPGSVWHGLPQTPASFNVVTPPPVFSSLPHPGEVGYFPAFTGTRVATPTPQTEAARPVTQEVEDYRARAMLAVASQVPFSGAPGMPEPDYRLGQTTEPERAPSPLKGESSSCGGQPENVPASESNDRVGEATESQDTPALTLPQRATLDTRTRRDAQ